MKKNNLIKVSLCLLALLTIATPVFAQRGQKPIIFAVLNDGKMFEPIAYIEKGKLTAPVGGDADLKDVTLFNNVYYKPKTAYRLIFGGAKAGTATVVSSDPKAECSKNMAQISVILPKIKLTGFVMALATDALAKTKASGLRRKPTWAERTEIDKLVRAEFGVQKVSATALKTLNYHNLTALDVNNDKKAELVGSFWVNTGSTERGLLFFIAEKNSSGKYEFGLSEYKLVKQDEVMSGDITALDTGGYYHELLLDTFDYDGDGTGDIFTYVQGFEGAGFYAYKRVNGKWEKAYENSNYHCAF